jgi:aquaporin Z
MEPPSLGQRAVAEGIGTFFLVLIGPGAVMVDAYTGGALGPTGIALAFAVLAMVYALGHLSGAHIKSCRDPGLLVDSAGAGARRGTVPGRPKHRSGARLAGASLCARADRVARATLPHVGTGRSFLIEWLFSFVLMLVIMAVATDSRVADGFAGLAVGLTVGFCGGCLGLQSTPHPPSRNFPRPFITASPITSDIAGRT